jgi:hypothetical protein
LTQSKLIPKFDILILFDDLFESSSENGLEQLFILYENLMVKSSFLTESDSALTSKLQSMVSRICKTIIKKLSVTHDTSFRGRVQQFIAASCPLTHPSGISHQCYNKENRVE